jgi:hypothetical protein
MAQKYGKIFSLKLINKTVVVLSSIDAIHFILEKNSAKSSDRPPYFISEYVEGGRDTNMLAYVIFPGQKIKEY